MDAKLWEEFTKMEQERDRLRERCRKLEEALNALASTCVPHDVTIARANARALLNEKE